VACTEGRLGWVSLAVSVNQKSLFVDEGTYIPTVYWYEHCKRSNSICKLHFCQLSPYLQICMVGCRETLGRIALGKRRLFLIALYLQEIERAPFVRRSIGGSLGEVC